ncbi:MAG: hypothetical protein QNJ97_17795 [Myxococcota bacterium]|nr:hypothetical protein [Myxococcota bacterium]
MPKDKMSQEKQTQGYQPGGIGTMPQNPSGDVAKSVPSSGIPGPATDPSGATSQSHMRGKI